MAPRNNNHHDLVEWRVSEVEKKLTEVRDDLDAYIERTNLLINRALGALLTIYALASVLGYVLTRL